LRQSRRSRGRRCTPRAEWALPQPAVPAPLQAPQRTSSRAGARRRAGRSPGHGGRTSELLNTAELTSHTVWGIDASLLPGQFIRWQNSSGTGARGPKELDMTQDEIAVQAPRDPWDPRNRARETAGSLSEEQAREIAAEAESVVSEIATVVEGKDEVARIAVLVLLAGGHLLIEDIPGVGKTMLAKSLAASLGADRHRIQFTPDLLLAHFPGASVFNQATSEFEFRRGAVFTQILLADEINRASPKTQSALLEAMEERQVSVDGTTSDLAEPFMVVATANPVEMEGTYRLPEAQRDRFLAQTTMGYP